MKRRTRLFGLAVPFGMGVLFLLLPLSSQAAIDKCQAEIVKRTALFEAKVGSAVRRCADAIRREQVKNINKPGTGFLVVAAHRCQKEWNRILDLPQILGGKSERDKFFDAIAKAFTGSPVPKCTVDDLRQLGLLPSGTLGPGTNPWDFAKVWLAATALERSLRAQLEAQGDFLAALRAAIEAPSKPPGTSVGAIATNCTLGSTCDPRTVLGCRPDLCRIGLQCHTAACAIDTTVTDGGVRIDRPGSAPVTSVPAAASVGLCALTGLGYPLGDTGEGFLLAGALSRSLPPLSVAGKTVCAEIVRLSGYCACTSPFTNLPRDVALCQDRLLSNGNACTGSGSEVPGTDGPDPELPGTSLSALYEDWTDATSTGDCVALGALRLTLVASGGEGADGQPCTPDDLVSLTSSRSVVVPLTTGSVSASLADAITTPGGCSVSGTCIEDANCGSGQTCTNPGPTLGPLSGPSLAGNPLSGSCGNFLGGSLSGMQLVGSIPMPQVADLGDLVLSFKLACQ